MVRNGRSERSLLGWHPCRTKLPPNSFNSKMTNGRKMSTDATTRSRKKGAPFSCLHISHLHFEKCLTANSSQKGLAAQNAGGSRNIKSNIDCSALLVALQLVATQLRSGQSTVAGPKWTKLDLFRPKWTQLDHFGRFWSRDAGIQFGIRPKWTKMVVWTILDHFGPVHFPTVPRPLPISYIVARDL